MYAANMRKVHRHRITIKNEKAGNDIDEEGAQALSEALKVNTTLTTLTLEREQQKVEASNKYDSTTITKQITIWAKTEYGN